MSVFSNDSFDNHEQVMFCSDPESGLKAIIAVHSTALGPAVGGTRMWDYASEEDAVRDVLRLSRGMSYKNAMANLNLGGGKGVIIGDSRKTKTPALMRAYGRFIDSLGGRYITAEDMGMTTADMAQVASQTRYVAGLDEGDAASGDPSPFTSHGVLSGIDAAVSHQLGRDNLNGIRVAIQGVGHVGYVLAEELVRRGAEIIVADVVQENVQRAVAELGASAVSVDEILFQEVDVLAPCAMGAVINDQTLPLLNCSIIAGSANNQLASASHGQALRDKGILYAPDYVINAGGMISVANEVHGVLVSAGEAMKMVEEIGQVLRRIFADADAQGKPTEFIADQTAEALIAAGKAAKVEKAQSQAA
jgi:leucine dehydrogenase